MSEAEGRQVMTHLNPPDAAALDEVKNELDFVAAAMGFEPNSMKIMAHRPNILRGFLALMGAIIGPDAVLDPGLRQMIAHIASSAAGCRYCQAHTAHGAGHAGVSQEKIEALWSYADSPLFTEAERAALSLAQAGGSVPNRPRPRISMRLRRITPTPRWSRLPPLSPRSVS